MTADPLKKIGTAEGIAWSLSLHKRMEERKVPFLCFGGTLLGVVRDRALIPWDDDLDFLVPPDWLLSEQFSSFARELERDGFDLRTKGFPLFPSASAKNMGYKVTFSSLRVIGSQNLRPIYSVPVQLLSVQDFHKPCLLEAHGVLWPVPQTYEGMLTHVYGDWKKPVDWDGGSFYNHDYFNRRGKRFLLNILMRIYGASVRSRRPW